MEEKKFIAKQCDYERFNFESYYDEENARADGFCAFGNRDFCDFNGELKTNVERELDNCSSDINTIKNDSNDEQEIISTIRYYFKRQDLNELTDEEIKTLKQLCETWDGSYDDEQTLKDICAVLEIEQGQPFTYGTIRGNCSSDWLRYICPESLSDDYIRWIEAVLFATGTEFMISEEKCTEEELDSGAVFASGYYTNLYSDRDIKAWVAEECNCSEDEVKVLLISDSHTYVKYDYRTI